MKALVIYDSAFGNTEQIALAIGGGLGSFGTVEVRRFSEFTPAHLVGVNLLVVGSPTQGFNATEAMRTRLASIPPNALSGLTVASFDTRMVAEDMPAGVGRFFMRLLPHRYASQPISDLLVERGGLLAVDPEGFYVLDKEGPLKPGELERAAEWARAIVQSMAHVI